VTRGAWAAALAAVLLFVVAIGVVVVVTSGDDHKSARATPTGPVADALDDAKPADEPFADWTVTEVGVGGERLDVVVADEGDERFQGLRRRQDIGPYDGMLFVFDRPTSSSFTMSTVPVPLDIGFYDERGRLVDRLRMEPCPHEQSRCPLYSASGPFTYALETLASDLPRGDLTA